MNGAVGNGELSVGVRFLDCDHREMAGILCQIRTAVETDEHRNRTASLLRKLANFTRVHFALEEEMMAATDYPCRSLHLIQHQRLTEQMNALVCRYQRGSIKLNPQSLGFLPELHAAHIETNDLGFGVWLNDQPSAGRSQIYTSNES
ncbi:MAG: hemerythrin family protein [Terracidiphilus sp.]